MLGNGDEMSVCTVLGNGDEMPVCTIHTLMLVWMGAEEGTVVMWSRGCSVVDCSTVLMMKACFQTSHSDWLPADVHGL